jgi:hypothetical protein
MDALDTAAMRQRFQHRAEAVQYGSMPTGAGGEQAELDFQDFAIIADAEITMDEGILTIDLRPAISPTGFTDKREGETLAAMENIANAAREALIEDEDRPSLAGVFIDPTPPPETKALPTDGDKITPRMLDSKADLQALINGAEMFKVIKTIEPIDVNACPGLDLTDSPVVRRADDSDSPVVLPVVR